MSLLLADTERRRFLKGALALPALFLGNVSAAAQAGSGLGTPAFGRTGNFDLDDPAERLLARIKVTASLTGERTSIYSVSRYMMAPPGRPSYQLFAEFDVRTIWIEPAPDSQSLPRTRALFTKIPVDPVTFEPIKDYYNPYIGKTLPVQPVLYAGAGLPIDLCGSTPDIIYQQDKPHYRLGDDIVFVNFDPRNEDGPIQPHTDSAMLRVNFADLMNPAKGWVEAEYTIAAVRKASAYPWSGVQKGDEAQMLSMKMGRKVGRRQDLPPEFLRIFSSKFPDRI
jgi:hypothetical protein